MLNYPIVLLHQEIIDINGRRSISGQFCPKLKHCKNIEHLPHDWHDLTHIKLDVRCDAALSHLELGQTKQSSFPHAQKPEALTNLFKSPE